MKESEEPTADRKNPAWLRPSGHRSYVRFAAIGDSVTYGIGDPTRGGDRGWARILADAIGLAHDVSWLNVARPGAMACDVRRIQLPEALHHRPSIASLVVGMNDALSTSWDPRTVRADIVACAAALDAAGATLITFHLHDHSRILPLPRSLRRRLRTRIEELNSIYDDVHDRYGGIRVDLAAHPDVFETEMWSIDRLHPSEYGHRALAIEAAAALDAIGLDFPEPSPEADGVPPTWADQARWVAQKVLPWVSRHVADFVASSTVSVTLQLRTHRELPSPAPRAGRPA